MPSSSTWSFVAAALVAVIACGKNVDLGGVSDSGVEQPDDCDPCATAFDCQPNAACAKIGTNTFCAELCTKTSCDVDEACRPAIASNGEHVNACVPAGGTCSPAPPPPNSDAGSCGPLAGPRVAANCDSCTPSSGDCQPNGCYGGWWCDTRTHDCRRPPTSCE